MNIKKFIIRHTTIQEGKSQFRWEPMQIVLSYMGLTKLDAQNIIHEYLRFANHLVKSYGDLTAVKILKDLSSQGVKVAFNYRTKTPKVTQLGGIWISMSATGLPRQLKICNKLIKVHPRAILTLFAMVRMFVSKPSFDISTVTNAYTGATTHFLFTAFETFINNNRERIPVTLDLSNIWHSSMAAGPLGSPSILNCTKDIKALTSWVLLPDVKALLSMVGRTDLVDCINSFLTDTGYQVVHTAEQSILSKLAYLSDKAGKTRIVYILNYFLQEALYPLHNILMQWLRKQPQDGTYNQTSAAEKVRIKTSERKQCWCFDLTAATDRWPIWTQKLVIQSLVSNTWARLWEMVIKTQPFSKPHRMFVNYTVGQPMGALSSWAAFAVTHHFVLRFLCWKSGVEWDNYVILGDDLVIFDEKVAESYIEFTSALGVTISQGKSVIPEFLQEGHSAAEFAKRLFYDGMNFSPASSLLLYQSFDLHQYWKIIDLFRETFGYMEPQVGFQDTTLLVHPFIAALMDRLNPTQQNELLVILSSPLLRVAHLAAVTDQAAVTGWKSYTNPWGFNPGDDTSIPRMIAMSNIGGILMNHLQQKAQTLYKLKAMLTTGGQAMDGSPGKKDTIDSQSHPIKQMLLRLDSEIGKIIHTIQYCDESLSRDDLTTLVEIDFLVEVALGSTSYKTYQNLKDRKSKYAKNLVLNIYSQVKPKESGKDLVYTDW